MSWDLRPTRLKAEEENFADKTEDERQAKLDDARKLIEKLRIPCDNRLPSPIEPGTLSKGTVELQTNLFGIKMERDLTVYKYDVTIGSDNGKKFIEFSKQGNTDYILSERKKNCVAVFCKAILLGSFYDETVTYFYDGQSTMYTTVRIAFKEASKPCETVMIEGAKVHPDLERFNIIEFTVKECTNGGFMCRLSDIRKIDPDIMKKDRSAVDFVDVVTSMNALWQSDRFTVFSNGKIFPNHPDHDGLKTVPMKEGKVMIPGLNKTVKLIEGPKGRANTSPALAVDSLKVAFHVQQKLSDKALHFFNNLSNPISHEIDSFATAVYGLGCHTNHLKNIRKVEVHNISRENALTKKFEMTLEGGKTESVTVAQYFEIKYSIILKYPLAPLVLSRERGQLNLYPMEVLDVIPMQRVTFKQTTSAQSQVTTKECAIPPGARQNAIIEQCKLHDFFNPEQQYLKSCGLSIIETPLRVTARVLRGPVLQYKGAEMEVVQSNWRPPPNFKFFVPAVCVKWAIFAVVTPRDTISLEDLKKFAAAYSRRCRERGMEFPEAEVVAVLPQPGDKQSIDGPAREMIKSLSLNGFSLVFFISSDFTAIHNHIKLQERYSSIVTQDLKLTTARNYLEKNQSLTMDNIVFKTNLKLGGMNYGINLKNIVGTRINPFKPTRLVLGIAVSQAPQQQVFTEEGVKIPAPSVVGFAANMARHPTEYIGDHFYQLHKKNDLLLCTTEMMKRVMDRFIGAVDDEGNSREKTKALPTELIVYRQGVPESLYGMCLREELPIMKALLGNYGATDVKVTFVVVQKEHNIRLMNAQIDPREKATTQNITSGVVLDSIVTHPRYREFFLNSHITLQGTARTPRYTVLYDDADMTMNELQCVTHALCHDFQIVNSPVSIPAPLYIANRCSERGVNLYVAKATDDMATSHQKVRITNETYNVDLSYGPSKLGKVRINA